MKLGVDAEKKIKKDQGSCELIKSIIAYFKMCNALLGVYPFSVYNNYIYVLLMKT